MDKDIEIYFGKMETIVRTFSLALKEFDTNVLTSVNTMKATSNAMGENEEWTELYPEFAKVAREEGFEAIAITFERVSEVEKRHEARYNKLAKNIEEGKVFKKDEKVFWKCLNCGHIHEGEEAPVVCPTCIHPQGYFEVFVEAY